MVSINVTLNKKGATKGLCKKCATLKNPNYYLDKNALPVWRDSVGNVMYSLPDELVGLSVAEKLLIQRVAVFVPLHHIKNGTMGLTGHVCAFEQNINGFLTSLPRLREDVTMLKVLKAMKAEIGSKSSVTKAFRVRRRKVLEALKWLQTHNKEYSDVLIDESALDWIDGQEGTMEPTVIEGMSFVQQKV